MLTNAQIIDMVDMYTKQNKSTYVIAQKYNSYPNAVRRVLLKQGVILKSKSEAQKSALQSGKSVHPTQGKERSTEVKERISDGIFSYWKNLSDASRQKIVDIRKEQWYNMSTAERESMRDAAIVAVREAAVHGSRVEQFLRDELIKKGYSVIFHKKGLIPNSNLEIDLFLPALKTVIEIDGPSHFLPIWGEEKLNKHIKSDADKAGLILSIGLVIVRIKYLINNFSAKYQRELLKTVLKQLKQINKKFPEKGKRFIELEVEL